MQTTRRTLFSGAAALSAVAVMPPLPGRSISDMWSECAAFHAKVAARIEFPEEAFEALFALEDAVIRGPIRSRADAYAKLRCAALAFERGERADDLDAPAFEEAMRWLEAH